MTVVYYYVLYLKVKHADSEKIEIHLMPFKRQSSAEEYKKKADARYGDMVYHSLIKKVDVSKHEKGIWIK